MEYGSDFHNCKFPLLPHITERKDCRMYACGRHAIGALLQQQSFKRIWIPTYFCYEVVDYIRTYNIDVCFYEDNPLCENEQNVVEKLPFQIGDVLLRMNYFGMRSKRTCKDIPVPVIEDHSHGLMTNWALQSDADWCIASIRKTLPSIAGGILWSPRGRILPDSLGVTPEMVLLSTIRYQAMELKRKYLEGENVQKDDFRQLYVQTEEQLGKLSLSGMDTLTKNIFLSINLSQWEMKKQRNRFIVNQTLDPRFVLLGRDDNESMFFSLVLLTNSEQERECLRNYLIAHQIYPAVLWRIPTSCEDIVAQNISKRLLSIHCDGRYDENEMKRMCLIINNFYSIL